MLTDVVKNELGIKNNMNENDPLFSVIVPIYDITEATLKRCVMSIYDQNYSNIEVILVFDGPNAKLKKVVEPYVKERNWKAIEIEHGGACKARNEGFKQSNGEIVSFINSDYILCPGIIQLWVDKLIDNPECGFVYGSYEYGSSNRAWYPSKEFDPWLLKVANYIDCGFPLWRKYFVPWDENCKSLQDWDFWLRVIDTHKVKGHYLGRDVCFIAEPPRLNGLSMDSSNNWIERVKYVKQKNNIPLRDIVVTSLGAQNHGIEIAKMIDADYRDDTITKPNEYKSLYMIGFFLKPNQINNEHGPILSSFGDSVKKIVHFVGADIFWLRKFSYENLKALGGALKMSTSHVLVENGHAKEEIKDLLGIDSKIVPIPPYNDYELKPLPKNFSVSIFLTEKSDFDKYCKEHTLSVVRAMPDVMFTAYGDAAKDIQYPNLICVGNLSKEKWKEYVYGNSCYLRIVRHDTTPLASNEFMIAGRSVVSNIPNECTHLIDTKGESKINDWDVFSPGLNPYRWPETKKNIVQVIRSIKKQGQTKEMELLSAGLKTRFDRSEYIRKIYELSEVPLYGK